MAKALHFLCCLAVVSAPASVRAGSWADDAGVNKSYAASQAICAAAKRTPLPSPPQTVPKSCDPEALYYGLSVPADPAAARACALAQVASKTEPDDPIDAYGILATIYANGRGAPRNLDVAIAYACQINGAPAEIDGRVNHLAKLKSGPADAPFDVCDDATSGILAGSCAGRDAEIADSKRDAAVARLTSSLGPAAKSAFATLRAAERTYAKSVAENEVDASGTLRGAMATQAREEHEQAFVATLNSVIAGKSPSADAGAARDDADRLLNTTYAKIMGLKDMSGFGTVTKAGIKATQRTWLAYRDAFVAFAKADGSAVPPAALVTELTIERTKDLAAFLE